MAKRQAVASWQSWLDEGPAKGLRGQHRLSRTASAWIPSIVAEATDSITDKSDDVAGIDEERLKFVISNQHTAAMPLSAQAEVGVEALRWSQEWQCDMEYDPPQWPSDLGMELPEVGISDLKAACATFPAPTGLGWDGIHPRALLRLSDRTL